MEKSKFVRVCMICTSPYPYKNRPSYRTIVLNRTLVDALEIIVDNIYGFFRSPVHPDVKLVKLPFYDVMSELLKPASLLAQGGNRFHETRFDFYLTPQQATDIASNRDVTPGSRMDFLYQVLWFPPHQGRVG